MPDDCKSPEKLRKHRHCKKTILGVQSNLLPKMVLKTIDSPDSSFCKMQNVFINAINDILEGSLEAKLSIL